MTRRRRCPGWVWLLAGLALTAAAAWFTGCDVGLLWARRDHLADILRRMFPPDWGYFARVWAPLWATVQMSVTGTALGSFLALLTAPLCAAGLGAVPAPVRHILRALVQVLRSFPALILALAATFLFGLGAFAGTAAITLYTFAIMTRLTYDDIDAAPDGAFTALTAMGAPPCRAFFAAVLPRIAPSYLANALYMLETNVRHSAILGYVGAGGVGLLLSEKLSWREYEKVGAILLALFLAVCLVESASAFLTAIVTGRRKAGRGLRRAIIAASALLFLACTATVGPPDFAHASLRAVGNMLLGLVRPDWAFFFQGGTGGLGWLLLETAAIALAGTAVGAALSLPLALLGSGRLMPRGAAALFRLIPMAVRSVPFLVYGLVFIRATGPGAFTGVLTIAVCSVGLVTKRFTEAIDGMDMRAWDALAAMGVPALLRVRYALLPQLLPAFGSAVLYRFDVNLREASVLGMVGAGGIGAPLVFAMNRFQWPTAGAIAIGLVLMVWLVDLLSARLQKR